MESSKFINFLSLSVLCLTLILLSYYCTITVEPDIYIPTFNIPLKYKIFNYKYEKNSLLKLCKSTTVSTESKYLMVRKKYNDIISVYTTLVEYKVEMDILIAYINIVLYNKSKDPQFVRDSYSTAESGSTPLSTQQKDLIESGKAFIEYCDGKSKTVLNNEEWKFLSSLIF